MSKKKKKKSVANKHGLTWDKVDEIKKLSHKDLVERMTLEYRNLEAVQRQKKDDTKIREVKASISDIKVDLEANPEFVKAKEEFEAKKAALESEEQARYKEELDNLLQPYNEDIKFFRASFKTAMEEMQERKERGVWAI
jgi:tRNA U34 5-carboxymethylaminomethyl modifying GTPase MnmE/TrmE